MTAFYAGSFDPFTIGHLSIANRALDLFEKVIIGIGFNKSKTSEIQLEERLSEIKKLFEGRENVEVIAYHGLTAPVAKERGASVLVRGVRNTIDFEKEKELADINLKVFSMPTVMIPADPDYSYVSSSMVRELRHFGYNAEEFLPGQMKDYK